MIKPIRLSDIPPRNTVTSSETIKYLKDWISTSSVAGEIVVPVGKQAKYTCAKYRNAAKRLNLPVQVMMRGDRVFIRRKEKIAPGAATPKGEK